MNRLLFRPTTTNRKTGNIPTASIHHDHIPRSCKGCPMSPDTGGNCYARTGTASFATERTAMASTYTLSAYLKATRAGWRATLVVPAEVIADHVEHGAPLTEVVEVDAVACPAQVGELTGRPVQCNDCGLCSVKHQADAPGVWFAEHGPRVKRTWRKRVEAAKERRRAAMRGGDSCG
jgi:hypothetical protein